jgi:hypothetical protein
MFGILFGVALQEKRFSGRLTPTPAFDSVVMPESERADKPEMIFWISKKFPFCKSAQSLLPCSGPPSIRGMLQRQEQGPRSDSEGCLSEIRSAILALLLFVMASRYCYNWQD